MLVKDLAERRNVVVITQRRQLKSLVADGIIKWDIEEDKIFANTEVPREVLVYYEIDKAKEPESKVVVVDKPLVREPKIKKEKKVESERQRVFGTTLLSMVASGTIMMADAVAFAWIAWNGYEEFQHVATFFFFFVGMAVGYASIWSVINYKGSNEEVMVMVLWIVQAVLHLSALGVLGAFSYDVGKVVVAMAIPTGGSVLAVALKPRK